MKLNHSLIALAALFSTAHGNAFAVNITLDFNSLPSAQGWQLINNTGLGEADIYSVNGTSLTQNTIGVGVSGWAYYQMPNVLDLSKSYSFDVRARIISEEFSSTGAFSFSATAPGWYSLVSLGVSKILIVDAGVNPLLSYDNSVFHDYKFVVSTNRAYDLFIDGILQHSGTVDSAVLPNLIYFGDVGSSVNGQVEITKLSFQQPAPIPEPATMIMMISGLGLLLVRSVLNAKRA